MPKSTKKTGCCECFSLRAYKFALLLLLLLISKLNYYKLVQHFTTECLYNQILNVNNNEILKSRYKVTRECFENKLYVIRKYSRRPRHKFILRFCRYLYANILTRPTPSTVQ